VRVANGKAIGRFEAALGVVGVLALVTTYVLITGWNPVPGFLDWLARTGSLSQPETLWKSRLGGRPEYAVTTDRAVIAFMRGAVEVRDAGTGGKLWAREVAWAAAAGAGAGTVVVLGRGGSRGYEVVDAATGAARWDDRTALAAWTYRAAVLALTCASVANCTLASREPAGGRIRWRTTLPGVGKALAGVNHELLGNRALLASTVDSRVATPAELPDLLGFPLDGKVQVIETATGRRLPPAAAGGQTRVVVVGGRVLYSTAERRQGQCRYSLEARDAASGQSIWHKEGYDLRTASGAGCEQRRDPAGGGGALAAVRGDNREVLLDAAAGRELWVGRPGERALATDGRIALVRTADGKGVKAVDLGRGAVLWERPAARDAGAAITRFAALVVDGERVRAFELGTGRTLVDVKSAARVIGCGPSAVVLSSGRTVGVLPFGAARS
jgi:outer membrane protein assembly factor BamB